MALIEVQVPDIGDFDEVGASAARFNAYLGSILADFRRVLL